MYVWIYIYIYIYIVYMYMYIYIYKNLSFRTNNLSIYPCPQDPNNQESQSACEMRHVGSGGW